MADRTSFAVIRETQEEFQLEVMQSEEGTPCGKTAIAKNPRINLTISGNKEPMAAGNFASAEGTTGRGRCSWGKELLPERRDLLPEERDLLSMVWRPLIHHLEEDPEYIYWVPPIYRLTVDILRRKRRSTKTDEASQLQSTYIGDSLSHIETPFGADEKRKTVTNSLGDSRDSGSFSGEDPFSPPYMTRTPFDALATLPCNMAFQRELKHAIRSRAKTSFLEEEAFLRTKMAKKILGLATDEDLAWLAKHGRDLQRPQGAGAQTLNEGATGESEWLPALPLESPSVVRQHLSSRRPQELSITKNSGESGHMVWQDQELPGKKLPTPSYIASQKADSAYYREVTGDPWSNTALPKGRNYDPETTDGLLTTQEDSGLHTRAIRYPVGADDTLCQELDSTPWTPATEDTYQARRSDPSVPLLLQLRLSLVGLVGILILGCIFMAVLITSKGNDDPNEISEYTTPATKSYDPVE